GLHRSVLPQARVMVHGIWLGDRREDAQSASYSADDLALVQRDIGQLVQYTSEMGGSMELLETGITDSAVGAYASPNRAGCSVHAD
ncbi:MAG: hypothetical protein WB019_05895, partial [Pseudolabrys sp.]